MKHVVSLLVVFLLTITIKLAHASSILLDQNKELYFVIFFEHVVAIKDPNNPEILDLALADPRVEYFFDRPFGHRHNIKTSVPALLEEWKAHGTKFSEGMLISDKQTQSQKPIIIYNVTGTSSELHIQMQAGSKNQVLNEMVTTKANVISFALHKSRED